MTEGNDSPRAQPRAGSIRYASALAVLRESSQQLGDLIRLQAAEYDRLTSGSLDIGIALQAWRYATATMTDALARLEAAHAAFDVMTPDTIRILREAEDRTVTDG